MSNKKGSSFLVLKNDINYSISDDDKPGEQQMGASYGDLEVLIEIEYEEMMRTLKSNLMMTTRTRTL